MSSVRTGDQLVGLVRELVALPHETEWLEEKENNTDPEAMGEYVSALANSSALVGRDRGYLLWGVQDGTRSLVGTSFKPHTTKKGNESLRNWLTRLLEPEVHFAFHEISLDGLSIVLLEVERAMHQPVRFRNEEYIRVGSHKKRLREHPALARRLWRMLVTATFEAGVAADRLGPSEVLKALDYPSYFDLMNIPLPENRAGILEAFLADGLVTSPDDGSWSITNLGAVLFAKRLGDFPSLHRKAARVIRYRGTSRAETVKEQAGVQGYASRFEGLVSYIDGLLPSNEVIGQALRRTTKMYPELAIRELVANALIHQDFSLTGTGPVVEVFDDRVEITNPGTPLVDPLRFIDSPPRSRNERLASVMRRGGICEERGSGWDKIGFEIEFSQLPAPLIEVTPEHTRIVLFSHRDLKEMDRADRVRAVYLHACLRHVTRQKVTNSSIRERFHIDARNSAKASRLIKEATEQGMIVPRQPDAARKLMEYVPWWAAPESDHRPRFL